MRERPTIGTTAATTARPGRAQPREDSRAQGDRHARVPGQVPQPGRIATPDADAADQCRRPGPAHHLLDQLGQRPGTRACGEQAARKLTVVRQQRRAGCRRHGTERAQLHDDPDGTVQRAGQAVDGPERPGLAVPHPVPARRQRGDQHRCRTQAEPDPRISQPAHGRALWGPRGPLQRCRHGGPFPIAGTGKSRHGPSSTPGFSSPVQEPIAGLGRTAIAAFRNVAAAGRHSPGTAVPGLFRGTAVQKVRGRAR
jgi:hypothetical protein